MTLTHALFDAALAQCFNDLRHTQFIVDNATTNFIAEVRRLHTAAFPPISTYALVEPADDYILHAEIAASTAAYFNRHGMRRPERMPRSLGHRPAARRLFGFSPMQRRQTKRRRYLARLRRA